MADPITYLPTDAEQRQFSIEQYQQGNFIIFQLQSGRTIYAASRDIEAAKINLIGQDPIIYSYSSGAAYYPQFQNLINTAEFGTQQPKVPTLQDYIAAREEAAKMNFAPSLRQQVTNDYYSTYFSSQYQPLSSSSFLLSIQPGIFIKNPNGSYEQIGSSTTARIEYSVNTNIQPNVKFTDNPFYYFAQEREKLFVKYGEYASQGSSPLNLIFTPQQLSKGYSNVVRYGNYFIPYVGEASFYGIDVPIAIGEISTGKGNLGNYITLSIGALAAGSKLFFAKSALPELASEKVILVRQAEIITPEGKIENFKLGALQEYKIKNNLIKLDIGGNIETFTNNNNKLFLQGDFKANVIGRDVSAEGIIYGTSRTSRINEDIGLSSSISQFNLKSGNKLEKIEVVGLGMGKNVLKFPQTEVYATLDISKSLNQKGITKAGILIVNRPNLEQDLGNVLQGNIRLENIKQNFPIVNLRNIGSKIINAAVLKGKSNNIISNIKPFKIPILNQRSNQKQFQVQTQKVISTNIDLSRQINLQKNLSKSALITKSLQKEQLKEINVQSLKIQLGQITRNLNLLKSAQLPVSAQAQKLSLRQVNLLRNINLNTSKINLFTPNLKIPKGKIQPPELAFNLPKFGNQGKIPKANYPQPKKYQPSLVAREFNIKAPSIPKLSYTGLVTRPIISRSRRKK